MYKQSDLKILCSARIRLSPEQRQELKDAYRRAQAQGSPVPPPLVNRGSSISVENAPVQSDIHKSLGLPHIVILDLLNAREAMSLPTVLLFQKVLGVQLISDKELKAAFEDYLAYVHGGCNAN